MLIDTRIDPESKMLMELNELVYQNPKWNNYHMEHIKLVRKYSLLLNKRLGTHFSRRKLSYISLAHDLLKESGLDTSRSIKWNGHEIPQDTTRYVRTNLDVLEEYGLDEYFNSSCQYHALSAGIFLRKELGVKDPEILYPVMFHSCPIISIYETLSYNTRTMVDIISLADKLSSNYLRINYKESMVPIDLDLAVFGDKGNEFNYTLGLFLARLISQGNSNEIQSQIATDFYYNRLNDMNPIIAKGFSNKRIGGKMVWPKRKSQAFRML